ncbi:hypothetical protein ACFX2A_029312 [Malus domestica]
MSPPKYLAFRRLKRKKMEKQTRPPKLPFSHPNPKYPSPPKLDYDYYEFIYLGKRVGASVSLLYLFRLSQALAAFHTSAAAAATTR